MQESLKLKDKSLLSKVCNRRMIKIMIKKLLSFLTLFTLLISPAFAEELEGFYYYYQLPEIYYETKSSKTTVDEAILQAIQKAIQKGEYHELETLLETSTSKVDPKTAERLVELVKNNRLKEAEELFETGSTSASEWVGETSTSWSGIRYDTGVSLGNQAKKMSKRRFFLQYESCDLSISSANLSLVFSSTFALSIYGIF